MSKVEDNFVTTDKDTDGNTVTFNMIEDEDGSMYWGHGHVDPREFIAEVNRWLVHTLGDDEQIWSDPEDLKKAGGSVEHQWAVMEPEDDWRFTLAKYVPNPEVQSPLPVEEAMARAGAFPVTRLML